MQNQSCFGGRLIVAPLVHLLLIPSTPMHLKLINNPLCYLTDHIIIREVQLKSCHTLIKKCSFNFFEQCIYTLYIHYIYDIIQHSTQIQPKDWILLLCSNRHFVASTRFNHDTDVHSELCAVICAVFISDNVRKAVKWTVFDKVKEKWILWPVDFTKCKTNVCWNPSFSFYRYFFIML